MSSYAKFLKEIPYNKDKLEDNENVALIKECNPIIQNKLPLKLNDPRSFSISYIIGTMSFERALCDLMESLSLMPLPI